ALGGGADLRVAVEKRVRVAGLARGCGRHRKDHLVVADVRLCGTESSQPRHDHRQRGHGEIAEGLTPGCCAASADGHARVEEAVDDVDDQVGDDDQHGGDQDGGLDDVDV